MASNRPKSMDDVMQLTGGFGWYQLQLLLTTELSYLICTGSLLAAKYLALKQPGFCWHDGPNGPVVSPNSTMDLCNCSSVTFYEDDLQFTSLFMHLGVYCKVDQLELGLNFAAMGGGVIGAIVFGYLADLFGRRLMCIIALTMLILADFVLAATTSVTYAMCVMVVIGVSCGGVMTGNLAFLMECVGPSYRLLCAALNGWPLGIMVMALTGYLTGYWRWYVITTACLGIPFWIMFWFSFESPRWLVQHNRFDEATAALNAIVAKNRKPEIDNLKEILIGLSSVTEPDRTYSYFDLFRDRNVAKNLAALFYSWIAAAIVSYGIYFTMGALNGNLFLNFFLLGLFKGSTGIIPYFASNPPFNIGRKPIITTFVTIACIAIWLCIILFYAVGSDVKGASYLIALTVIGGAAIDPIWKINHLYSAELFPTVVRGMARGVCNVGSRVGSALSPVLKYLSTLYFIAPYWIFGGLAIGHILVVVLLLPETKGKPLPERLDDRRGRVEPMEMRVADLSTK